MPVTIEQVDVIESSPDSAAPSAAPVAPPPPDPREIARLLRVQHERLARVRAH